LYYCIIDSFSVCNVRPARPVLSRAPCLGTARGCLSLPCKSSKERAPQRAGKRPFPFSECKSTARKRHGQANTPLFSKKITGRRDREGKSTGKTRDTTAEWEDHDGRTRNATERRGKENALLIIYIREYGKEAEANALDWQLFDFKQKEVLYEMGRTKILISSLYPYYSCRSHAFLKKLRHAA